MPDRNWGQIRTGATFESLATTLIFFEDPGAALFGRRGKDGGQDARSSDKTCVFQAKHHTDGSPAKAIVDAKKEATKIRKYRTSGHPREPQWRDVTHWRLVSNAAFNPTDRQRWDDEVVPLFSAQGLVANYWEQANLDALLAKHPEVDRAYFQNATRAFLSLPEVKEMLPLQEPFLKRDVLGTFVGRDSEVQKISSFLTSKHLFLVVVGAGGVGKTRVVVEAGDRIASEGKWQVLWANVESMESSGTWFDGIVPERPTLLVVDEPRTDQILRVLAEQLQTRVGRVSKWKTAITVRSPKDPVLKFLLSPRMKQCVDVLTLDVPPPVDAESMCVNLIASGPLKTESQEWQRLAGNKLASRFSNHPVWITLAVHALETDGELAKVPQSAADLAEYYLSEVVDQKNDYSPGEILTVLRWVSLLGTVNRQDDFVVELLARQAQLKDLSSTRRALARFVNRRALAERGAHNRLVEVKPDVLRDHLLWTWLAFDSGCGANPIQPSDDADFLVRNVLQATLDGRLSHVEGAILTSLARTELALQQSGQTVDLLGTFVEGVLQSIGSAGPSCRIAIAETFVELAAYRPEDTLSLSKALRSSPCNTERIDGIFGVREIGPDDVLLELAWLVFHAAFGAKSATVRRGVLTELCELAEAESSVAEQRGTALPSNGKRAKDLIGRVLEGGPQFWSDFEDAARAVGKKLLDETTEIPPSVARQEVLKGLLIPAMSVERRQIWSDDHTLHIQTSTILPGQPAWTTLEILKKRVRALLEEERSPDDSRPIFWQLLAEAHHNLNRCYLRGPQDAPAWMRLEILEDLTWAQSVLSRRTSNLDEISAARDLWEWHIQYEGEGELRAAAETLEKLYESNDLAAEFQWFLNLDKFEELGRRSAKKAQELADMGRAEIEAFLIRAASFFGNEQELYRVSDVAWELGARAEASREVQEFIRARLADPNEGPQTNFAAIAATRWVADQRSKDPSIATTLVADLLRGCSNDAQRINLLIQFYGQPARPKELNNLSNEEYRLVRSQEQLFLGSRRGPEFVACIGWGIGFEWKVLTDTVERVFDAISDDQKIATLHKLVGVLFTAVRERESDEIPKGIGLWILEQLIRVPDFDNLGDNLKWSIGEVLKRVGKAPMTWLPGAIERRREIEAKHAHGKVRALSHHMRLSDFVASIGKTGEIKPEIEATVCALLEFISDTGSVGYYLPEVLRDVDPHGRVVPEQVAQRFVDEADRELRSRLARISSIFTVGTIPWRTIAKPVLERAAAADTTDERLSLYSALTDHGPRSWSGTPGEVPAIFSSVVDIARQRLEAETDSVFCPFWERQLAEAEAELRYQEEHAKEERGE